MGTQPEPCSVCGEDTSTGSPLYSDRRVFSIRPGTRVFLCSICAERAVAARRRSGMTDEERRELEKGAAVFGAFAPGGH